MLFDIEVSEFEEMWTNLVEECGLEEHGWVCELYEKKAMWATAHIREKFFAGLRTTSRCEGLHAVIGKYVKKGYNLVEFIEQFDRCLEQLRSKEVEADFKSQYTEPVLQTDFEPLERYGAQIYTREVFEVFRKILLKTSSIMMVETRETPSSTIFIMGKYRTSNVRWHVCFYPYENEFNCSCQRMESNGIPCAHILKVLIYLHMDELPKCLVLERWTRGVKEGLGDKYGDDGERAEAMQNMMNYGAMMHSCRQMCQLACLSYEDLIETKEIIHNQKMKLKGKHSHCYADDRDQSGRSLDTDGELELSSNGEGHDENGDTDDDMQDACSVRECEQ